ncbi:MAG: hypothetical protein Q8O67_34410 [Deltaproteobacteria bacterium]|nr:hypothetical protein [Deltaproteobacteria bacterium]
MTLNDLPLDVETRAALEALSRRMKRSPEQIAADAVRDVVRDTEALLTAIEVAKGQADNGETITLGEWRDHLKQRNRPT